MKILWEEKVVVLLGAFFQHCIKLDTISVGGNSLHDQGVEELLNTIISVSTTREIRSLSLANNSLTQLSGPRLANFIVVCNVQRLFLAHNNLGNEGVKSIFQSLKISKSLRWLKVDENNVNDEGALVLCDILKDLIAKPLSKNLKLQFAGNNIR
jgi:Ran GTPase-activating protein (RanGAP) involved in mRNA processing and transport